MVLLYYVWFLYEVVLVFSAERRGCPGVLPTVHGLHTWPTRIVHAVRVTARMACWLECRTRDWKVVSLNPGWSRGRIVFSRVNFVCWLLFGVHSNPALPQWHMKDPGHSAKSADGRLQLSTYTSLTQRSRSGLTMPQSRHSVGTYQERSLHPTRQGTPGP